MASSSCATIPAPVRIQWHADGGPVLHYDKLTATQLEALDLLPPAFGKMSDAVVRRHRGGLFSARAHISALVVGETAYKAFRARLLGGAA